MTELRTLAWIGLASVWLVGLVPAPGAAAAPGSSLVVTAHDDGGTFWFTVEGQSGRNPPIQLEPGQRVDIVLKNEGTVGHNLLLPQLGLEIPCCVSPGERTSTTWTVPAEEDLPDGELTYVCEPHRHLGMGGQLDLPRPTPMPPMSTVLVLGAAGLVLRSRA